MDVAIVLAKVSCSKIEVAMPQAEYFICSHGHDTVLNYKYIMQN